jgi:hypothetical protein
MSSYQKIVLYIIIYSCFSCITVIAIGFRELDKSWTQLFRTLYQLLITISRKLDQSFLKIKII